MEIDNTFVYENEVRDSELDFQGIVNNANYFVYMEHARHKHLQSLGIDFVKMHEQGFDLVLVRTEIDFKAPLKSGDEFIVTSKLEGQGRIRFVFLQEVVRKSDKRIMATAKNIGTCILVATGRPVVSKELKSILRV